MTDDQREEAFLADLAALSAKHGIVLEDDGCGCCGSMRFRDLDREMHLGYGRHTFGSGNHAAFEIVTLKNQSKRPDWARTIPFPPEPQETPMSQPPSIGRIVHYTSTDGLDNETVHAAIIVAVHQDEIVNLSIWGTDGDDWHALYVSRSDVPKVGHWNWPPRV